jgi:eukaryotic-like serine/threonine-protein kinase
VDSLTPSPDGARMFTYGWDDLMHVWDAESGRRLQAPVRLDTAGRRGITVSPSSDGSRALMHVPARRELKDSISVWRNTVPAPVLRHRVEGFRNFNTGAMSPDGTLGWMGTDGYGPTRCHVYEIATGRVLLDVPTIGEVYGVLFSPDHQRCYVVTNAGTLHGFSLKDGTPLWPPDEQDGGIIPAALSPDGARLAAGYSDGHLRIFDTATGKVLHDHDELGELRVLRFDPAGSGNFLSAGMAGELHLWNVLTGGKRSTFTGHTGTILAASWSRDSRRIATAGGDTTVRVWDVATGKEAVPPLAHLAVPTHLEFSPDGTRLATVARDGTARLWDPRTGEPVSPPLRQGLACTTVRFTADGAAFFVHDHDGFRFWDTATALPVTLHYQEPVAGGFAFDSDAFHHFMAPDGTRVFLSYARNDGVAHTIPQPRGTVPEWFPGFLEMLGQLQQDPGGALRLIPRSTAAAFAEKLTADGVYEAWAREVMGLNEEGRKAGKE